MCGYMGQKPASEAKLVENRYLNVVRVKHKSEIALKDWNKELDIIYAALHLLGKQDLSLENALLEMLNLMPNAWQYPEATCAQIRLATGEEFKTSNFKETSWKQTADIIMHGTKIGLLEVFYLDEMPQANESTSLAEERKLIDFLGEVLGLIINHKCGNEILDIYRTYTERIGQEKPQTLKMGESLAEDLLEWDRYEIAFGSSGMGLWDWDLSTDEIYFSPGWKSMLGYLESELGNSSEEWFSRTHPEDIEHVRSSLQAHLEGRTQSYEEEFRILHDDGTYRWVICRGTASRDAEQNPCRMIGVIIDITERKKIEDELGKARPNMAEQNQRLKAVLDSMDDAIAMFDLEGNILFHSRNYGRIFGLTDEELSLMPSEENWQYVLGCFQETNRVKESVKNFLADPQNEIRHVIEIEKPKRKTLYHCLKAMEDERGTPFALISLYRDMSDELVIQKMKAKLLSLRSYPEKRHFFNNIIGRSREMKKVYHLMRLAANSDIAVLIQGESGTGKELVARAIHLSSERKNGPIVAVNCAAIPETLVESELFGYERGAFTGASTQRIGKFEQARGGTIILDEVGCMSSANQAALLRVLQSQEIQRVGGNRNIPIDARVIAVTNRNIETAKASGNFREDLYYRISAFPIVLPPLRERPDDIPLLAEHFLIRFAKHAGKQITSISDEAMKCLVNYRWPGNVRELENVISRAVLLETFSSIRLRNLPSAIKAAYDIAFFSFPKNLHAESRALPTLAEVEKRMLRYALKVTGGNISEVARVLGIGRVTVYRKLEKHNLVESN